MSSAGNDRATESQPAPLRAAPGTGKPQRPAESLGPRGYVERLTRSSGSNFFYAFFTLGRRRRDAIYAVYAFCHAVDEAVDEAPDPAAAATAVSTWRDELTAALAGRSAGPVATRVAEVAHEFGLPQKFLHQVVDGVAMDVEPRRFESWPELAVYCDLVAGAVGRLCVRIFGRDDSEADRYASCLGNALQLTNILRDIGPDAAAGRFYLPQADLARFGIGEREVLAARG
ncbi:MAG: squalene/phytoene synthase family protein, partial [Myxococcales bacterium]|nr:squalene/phytoene synthase family protein [Myxococcales bacterium]